MSPHSRKEAIPWGILFRFPMSHITPHRAKLWVIRLDIGHHRVRVSHAGSYFNYHYLFIYLFIYLIIYISNKLCSKPFSPFKRTFIDVEFNFYPELCTCSPLLSFVFLLHLSSVIQYFFFSSFLHLLHICSFIFFDLILI